MLVIRGWVWYYYFSPSISITRRTIKHTYLDEWNQMMVWWDTDETMLCFDPVWLWWVSTHHQLMELLVKLGGVVFWVYVIHLTTWVGAQLDGPSLLSISIPFGKHNQEPNHGKSRCTNWTESNTMVYEYVTTS